MQPDIASGPSINVQDARPESAQQPSELRRKPLPPASSVTNQTESGGSESPMASATIETSSSHLEAQNRTDLPDHDLDHEHITSRSSDVTEPSEAIKEQVRRVENVDEFRNWTAAGVASKDNLKLWFPKIGENEHTSWRIWMSKRSQALLLHTTMIAAVLIANFTLTLYAHAHYPHSNGVGIIYQGSCSKTKLLNIWLHLLINLLSTGMLMASNYCMQLLAAPTRADINRAHELNKWLDIGVPSVRNFTSIGRWRQFSWILLASTSLPLHLIYNSAVFTSLASNDYTVTVVNSYFLNSTSSSWNLDTAASRGLGDPGYSWVTARHRGFPGWQIPILSAQDVISEMQHNATIGSYTRSSVSSCFKLYNDYWSPLGNVVIVTKNDTRSPEQQVNDSLLIYASIIPRNDNYAKNQWAVGYGPQSSSLNNFYSSNLPSGEVVKWYLSPRYYEVDYCYIQPPATAGDRCRFEYSPQIMITVCILNLLKTGIMIVVWWTRKYQWAAWEENEKQVLYTLGDAIQSFLQTPELKTADMCLATKDDFTMRRTFKTKRTKAELILWKDPRQWQERKPFWGAAASSRRWAFLLSIWVIILAISGCLLGLGVKCLSARSFLKASVPSWWLLGFGHLTPYTYLNIGLPTHDPAGLISNILLANFPQLILSILYVFYNAILSCFLVQKEFSEMFRKQRPLRVSEPEGIQRSTYFISLPLRYGIPFYASSGIMHWLISQSLFLARITAFFPDGSVDNDSSFSTCGYSPIALFITILVGIALAIGLVLVGFRRYKGVMPLVATNSFAISAACHGLRNDVAGECHLLPLRWGVVSVQNRVGHCAFSTAHDTEKPNSGLRYA
ncbi:hypothetical protein BKA64DRAFT_652375 [Cadophora sp. MPI-SDFR-AT-0126]|nr:hypothetical protein BKA64DRAFT_652375 [Leotiomycetes sp. MPI-SDFR-AT-0126]